MEEGDDDLAVFALESLFCMTKTSILVCMDYHRRYDYHTEFS